LELPPTDYREAWDLQRNLLDARKNKILDTDIVLILEHPPVFTLGRRGGLENLMVSRTVIEKSGIHVIQVERGGNITFHGPGQLVVYPIISLKGARLKLVDYVSLLEEVMIRTAAEWGVHAERNPINRGVWVGSRKLGSIGIAVRKGICFHGLAFNANLSLRPFAWIQPCGLQDISMTSLRHELSQEVSMDRVREAAKRHIKGVFGVELVMTDIAELQNVLQ
jgi:lipoate-protein ligase B